MVVSVERGMYSRNEKQVRNRKRFIRIYIELTMISIHILFTAPPNGTINQSISR